MRYSISKLKYWLTCLLVCLTLFPSNVSALTEIATADKWLEVAKKMAGNAGAAALKDDYVITADLDFTGKKFIPFGGLSVLGANYSYSIQKAFTGTLDGQNHKLSNITDFIYRNNSSGYEIGVVGFARGADCVIKNLIVDNYVGNKNWGCFSNARNNGGICGNMSGGTIENCALLNSYIFGGSNPTGGIVAYLNGGNVKNCVVDNVDFDNTPGTGSVIGGIAGNIAAYSVVTDCYVNANFKEVENRTGGLVGMISYTTGKKSLIENCYSTGYLNMGKGDELQNNGGLIGYLSSADVVNCGTSDSISVFVSNAYYPQTTGGAFGYIANNQVSSRNVYATGRLFFSDERGTNKMTGMNTFYGSCKQDVVFEVPDNCYNVREYYEYMEEGNYLVGEAGIIYGAHATLVSKDSVRSGCLANRMNDDQGLSVLDDIVWTHRKGCFNDYPVPFAQSHELLDFLAFVGVISSDDADALNTKLPSCGQEQSVFHIKSVADMAAAAKMVADNEASWSDGKTFIVDNDITGAVTTVIGSIEKPFLGVFDGGGHTINMAITGNKANVGVVGTAAGSAKIKNVYTTGSVSGSENVGGIVGSASAKVTISNCANGAAVSGSSKVGGIVGASAGSISGCLNVATIKGSSYVGGIAGTAANLIDCSNMGFVDCGNPATSAGIAGSASGTVKSCLSAGYVEGASIANGGTLSNCFFDEALALGGQPAATPFVMSADQDFGLLSTWDSEKGRYPVPAAVAASPMGRVAKYPIYFVAGDKANNVIDTVAVSSEWTCSKNDVLKYHVSAFLPIKQGSALLSVAEGAVVRSIPVTVAKDVLFSGGYGNVFSPFKITKNSDLVDMRDYVVKTDGAEGRIFELQNDITDGPMTSMIGSSKYHFKGIFRSVAGKTYNIPVDIMVSTTAPVGLFGENEGLIERVSVTGSVENGGSGHNAYVGGITGFNSGRIVSCVNDATVRATGNCSAGGVAGGSTGFISASVNIGSVASASFAGGITTSAESSLEVSDCFNGGDVKATTAAGIVAMTDGTPSINPIFSNNINVGAVYGSKDADALIYKNTAAPIITGGIYDNQHSLATSANETAVADSSRKLTNEKLTGWTSTPNAQYPQIVVGNAAKVAAAPVFLNKIDSADNVKHDFTVASGVSVRSAQGLLKIEGNKVTRVRAGNDTLILSAGLFSRRVPITIECAWDTVMEPDVDVCNVYAGVTYTKNTVLTVSEITDNTNPNADCGIVHIKKVNVSVGEAGEVLKFTGCGSYEYKGEVFKKDTFFTNKDCDYVNISIYPAASVIDSVVRLSCNQESYTYKASNQKKYTIVRGEQPISDSLLVVDSVRSKVCDCDSFIRRVIVTIPTSITETVIAENQCNTYSYQKLNGETITLGFPLEKRDADEFYIKPDFQDVVYRDTNFTSGKEFDKINVVKVSIFKSLYLTDTISHVGTECSSAKIVLSNGEEMELAGERYLNDTVFYDSLMSSVFEGCPQTIAKYKVRLKGISAVKDTIYIGSHTASKCTTCEMPIDLSKVEGSEYENVGFCDVLTYKMNSNSREVKKRSDFIEKIEENEDESSCGAVTPYKIRINSSVHTKESLWACDSLIYKTRANKTIVIRSDTSFSDTVVGVVPVCGCDSIWDVKVRIYSPEFKDNKVEACGSYVFSYLDKTKTDVEIVNDTVIVDTLNNHLGCDSVIRRSEIVIHNAFPAEVNTAVEAVACQTFTYVSPLKGDIVCRVDTMFNDSLVTIYGCDSVIPVKIRIVEPVVIDSVIHVCDEFIYKKRQGGTIMVELGDNPSIIDSTLITDVWKNVDPDLCDTIFNLTVCSHTAKIVRSQVENVCGEREYTRFDGSSFNILQSVTVYDTLKSRVCDCDSIVHIDSFTVGTPFYPTVDTELDTTLYGCRFNELLTYVRKSNAWNSDTTISYVPVSSESANQKGFLDIVRKSNPSVVALDTIRERTETGRYVTHYYWLAHDTMRTVTGCDSVVAFHVEYDGQHTLGRRYFYVDHTYAPFVFDGVTYKEPPFKKGVASHDSIEVVLPSTTGGCDTSYYAMIKMYPCKVIDTTIHWCDMATFYNLHNVQMKFYNDTVYTDTVRYNITTSDTARCDSVIKTWRIKVGTTTPVSAISPVYVGGCDVVTFHRSGIATNMYAEDTTFSASTMFRCRYINKSGCDSVVPVYAEVHKVEPCSVIIKRTDYYRYVSPLDNSITRVSSDTVIEERIPDAVTIKLKDGSTYSCDSVVVTQVHIRPAEWRDTVITGCDSVYAIAMSVADDSIRGEFDKQPKQWYYSDAVFDVPNSTNIEPYYHVKIALNKSDHRSVVVENCGEVTYKGKVYKKNTKLIERFTNINGCDSIDTVKIVVHPVIYRDSTISGCGYLMYGPKTYMSADVVYDTIRYKSGCDCDSIITAINLDVIEPVVVDRELDSCMFFSYPKLKPVEFNNYLNANLYDVVSGNDTVYTTNQSFYQRLGLDDNGCDSIARVRLFVNPCYPYPVIINKYNWILALNKDLLTKDVNASHITGYQWYKVEDGDDHLLLGANQSYYTEDQSLNGCYKVHVLFGKREIESEVICVDPAKTITFTYDVYPDPVHVGGKVSVKCNFKVNDATLEIYNMLGVKVYQGLFDAKSGSDVQIPYVFKNAGNYYLKLTVAEGTVLGKKLIVK